MKSLLVIFLLVAVLFLIIYPSIAFASNQDEVLEELTDKLVDISLAISLLLKQVNELLNSYSSLYSLTLGEYLKELFEDNEIILDKSDFFEEVKDPHLAYAKILNLIPTSSQSNQKITQREAKQIREQFLSIKDKLLLDGLYGKIDMHEHFRTGGDVEAFLKATGSLGISKILFVSTGLGPDNRGYKTHQKYLVKYIKKLYPEKIIVFCTIDEADFQAAEIFEQCLQDGGEGLKIIGGHPSFYDEPLNSENMYQVYQIAAKYQVPVLVHASIINLPQTKEELDQVYSDFPEVTFIHAHYCSAIFEGINLDQCAELLDNHPNLYIDLTMGGGIQRYHKYLREDLAKILDFIIKYQDRILFGSDIILDRAKYKDLNWFYERVKCDIDLHEQEEYTCQFGEKDWLHGGFNLDKGVLRKLYFENPQKVLGF